MNRMAAIWMCLVCAGTLWASIALAEVAVLPLQHRSVDEVLPVLRPLLEPDGAATGMNNQLILRGSPAALAEIRALLPSLDVPLRRLRITVLQDVDETTVNRLRGLSGTVGVGPHARMAVADVAGNGGLVVEAGRGSDRLRGRMQDGQTQLEDHKSQQVMVVEGGRALVRIGQAQPVTVRQQVLTVQGQVQTVETTQYREANSGFYVQPRLAGEQVTLEVTAQNDSPASAEGGYARQRQVSTTVTGRLGVWLVLGDLAQQSSGRSRVVGGGTDSSGTESNRVLLKVDEVR